MRFSLVLTIISRPEEGKRFLKHLDQQAFRNFELSSCRGEIHRMNCKTKMRIIIVKGREVFARSR